MDSVIQLFITSLRLLFDISVFGVPFLVWFVIVAFFCIFLKFLKGTK